MKVVNVNDVLEILYKYGKYIFVTDEKRYSSMVDEIANLKALEQKPCDDCISRQAVLDLAKKGVLISNGNYESVCKAINELPSVNPQPKTGHWIGEENFDGSIWYMCDNCKEFEYVNTNYCPNCGTKMEVSE